MSGNSLLVHETVNFDERSFDGSACYASNAIDSDYDCDCDCDGD